MFEPVRHQPLADRHKTDAQGPSGYREDLRL